MSANTPDSALAALYQKAYFTHDSFRPFVRFRIPCFTPWHVFIQSCTAGHLSAVSYSMDMQPGGAPSGAISIAPTGEYLQKNSMRWSLPQCLEIGGIEGYGKAPCTSVGACLCHFGFEEDLSTQSYSSCELLYCPAVWVMVPSFH